MSDFHYFFIEITEDDILRGKKENTNAHFYAIQRAVNLPIPNELKYMSNWDYFIHTDHLYEFSDRLKEMWRGDRWKPGKFRVAMNKRKYEWGGYKDVLQKTG